MNEKGDIVGLASEEIGLWQPQTGYYEQSTTNIWRCICNSIQQALTQHNVDPSSIKGLGFDATCSLAVFSHDTDEPVSVTGPNFDNADGNDRNIVLWLDHRPVEETKKINATNHNLLRYVGGSMSIEMEMPKVLWLKNNMPKELFDRCKFYDLTDALTHMATGNETRSFCSVVCKQGYVPVGGDGSVKGWQEDFLKEIGLEDLCEDNFKRMGGVDGVVLLQTLAFLQNLKLTILPEWTLRYGWRAYRYTVPESRNRNGFASRHPSRKWCDRRVCWLDWNRRRKS